MCVSKTIGVSKKWGTVRFDDKDATCNICAVEMTWSANGAAIGAAMTSLAPKCIVVMIHFGSANDIAAHFS